MDNQLHSGSWQEHIEFKPPSNLQSYQSMKLEGVKLSEVIHTIFSSTTAPTRSHKGLFGCDGWVFEAPNVFILQRPANCKRRLLYEFCRVYCCMKSSLLPRKFQELCSFPWDQEAACHSFPYLLAWKHGLLALQLQGCQELLGQRQRQFCGIAECLESTDWEGWGQGHWGLKGHCESEPKWLVKLEIFSQIHGRFGGVPRLLS